MNFWEKRKYFKRWELMRERVIAMQRQLPDVHGDKDLDELRIDLARVRTKIELIMARY